MQHEFVLRSILGMHSHSIKMIKLQATYIVPVTVCYIQSHDGQCVRVRSDGTQINGARLEQKEHPSSVKVGF